MKRLYFSFYLCTFFYLQMKIYKKDPIAIFDTSKGIVKIELKPKIAPKAVENFIGLAKKRLL